MVCSMSSRRCIELPYDIRQTLQLVETGQLEAVYDASADDDDEIDLFGDPFEVLSRAEERTGLSIVHFNVEELDS